MTNTRQLKSRNQREGWYHGCEETHRRVHRWFSLRNRKNLTKNQKRLYLHQQESKLHWCGTCEQNVERGCGDSACQYRYKLPPAPEG